MVFFPKYPLLMPHRVIFKGYVEEGEGQKPIRKTVDWVEEIGGFEDKLKYAAKHSFLLSAGFAIVDIRSVLIYLYLIFTLSFVSRAVSKLTERNAQLARFAFYTVPLTLGAVGWMGGVELGKSFLGKDSVLAWAGGAVIPGGIYGIWRRALHKGCTSTAFFAAIGAAYQHSTNMNYTNTFLFHNLDNPNVIHPWNPFTRDYSAWNITQQGTDKEWSHISEGIQASDPGPSWKKWEDEK